MAVCGPSSSPVTCRLPFGWVNQVLRTCIHLTDSDLFLAYVRNADRLETLCHFFDGLRSSKFWAAPEDQKETGRLLFYKFVVSYFTKKRPVSLTDFTVNLSHLLSGLTDDPVLPAHPQLLEHVCQILKVYMRMERIDRLEAAIPIHNHAEFFVLIGSLAFGSDFKIGDCCFEMVAKCLESQIFCSALVYSTLVTEMGKHAGDRSLSSSILKLLNQILVTGESDLVGQVLGNDTLVALMWRLFLEETGLMWQSALQTMTALFLISDEPRVAALANQAIDVFNKALACVSPLNSYKVNDDLSILLGALLDLASQSGMYPNPFLQAALGTPDLRVRMEDCGHTYHELIRQIWGNQDVRPENWSSQN